MNVSGAGSTFAAQQASQAVGLAVFKKSLNMQEQAVLQLLNALPSPSSLGNPPHLGQTIDVRV
jgi:hypothetical protein